MFRPYGRDPPQYKKCFSVMEQVMRKYGGRPHWAKAFDVRGQALRDLYPQWEQFNAVRRRLDPTGMFWNEWAQRVFASASAL